MVTNENYNFGIYSIMLTNDFFKKRKKKSPRKMKNGHFKNVQKGKF